LIAIADELGYGAARAALKTKVHSQEDPAVVLLHDIRRIFVRDNLHSVFTRELLVALHELQDSFWDEFPGIGGNEKLHRLSRDELYKLLAFKRIYRTNVRQGDKFAKGFYRSQFEAVWHQLFKDTVTCRAKSFARHRTGTGTAQEEE
jgi:hypothetical protein